MSALALSRWIAAGVATLGFPGLLLAHSNGALVYDCAAGLAHPLHGWDHLLAMIAVGVWAAQQQGRARLFLPLAFVGGTTAGALLGTYAYVPAVVEPLLAASVLVFGGLIAAGGRPTRWLSFGVVAGFALCHGLAHGVEVPVTAGYFAGLLFATAGLHTAGFAAGLAASRRSLRLPRALGVACAAAGCILLLV